MSAIDSDGKIYFTEPSSGSEWSVTDDEIKKLFDEDLIITASNITSHTLWDILTTLTTERQNAVNNFVDQELKKAQKCVFLAVFEATR
ncbi:hypothetical protein ACFQL7_20785 [Halocatena marina]|uniref:Uncharacterized protein n=1 Tax=Halocatena marina TaxID=2934937 RepID=A0ABD5YRI1_9EURY